MTLEPVHMKEISDIAAGIEHSAVDEKEPEELRKIFEMLRELKMNDKLILKAVGNPGAMVADIRSMCMENDRYKITYSSDSGSTNPILLENGLFLDVCHAALASTPTDLDLHRKRTIVCTGFTAGQKTKLSANDEWKYFDDGFCRSKVIQIDPAYLEIRAGRMVHDYSIYASESEHLLWMQPEFDKDGFMIMDGPLYPRQLMFWFGSDFDETFGKIRIQHEKNAKKIMQNYTDIVEFHLRNNIPVIGFVKTPAETQILRLLAEELKKAGDYGKLPWATDTQLFKSFLKLKLDELKTENSGRFKLAYTTWFWQPNQIYKENKPKKNSSLIDDSVKYEFDSDDYSVAFFMVMVPIDGSHILFKIECPYGFIKQEEERRKITEKILYELSIQNIPESLIKADTIAKININEKSEIKNLFSKIMIDRTYNNIRWGDNYEYE